MDYGEAYYYFVESTGKLFDRSYESDVCKRKHQMWKPKDTFVVLQRLGEVSKVGDKVNLYEISHLRFIYLCEYTFCSSIH